QFLQHIDKEYLLRGQFCVIATESHKNQYFAFPISQLEVLSVAYDFNIFYTGLAEDPWEELARRVIRAIDISGSTCGGVTALFWRSGDKDIVPETRLENQQ